MCVCGVCVCMCVWCVYVCVCVCVGYTVYPLSRKGWISLLNAAYRYLWQVCKYYIVINDLSYGLIFKGGVNHFMMCDAGQLVHGNVIFLNRCGLT